jgi:hypothetical protein
MKTLVLYVFHEYNDRVKSFIEKAIFKDDNIDFMIICNNLYYRIENLPDYVIYKNRNNIGFDFGGWSHGLLINDFYKNYDNYICVNSSVVGPYLPENYKGKWTDFFINGLKDNVKLFGSTINKDFYPHVQTFIFSLEKETLEFLIKCKIFSLTNHYEKMWDTIVHKEILMSNLVILNKWNIGCLIPYYKNTDFVKLIENNDVDNNMINGHLNLKSDTMYNEFYKKYWIETDIIFFKGNRDIDLNKT